MSKQLLPGHKKPNLTEDGRISGVRDPAVGQDVATKAYVDLAVANLSWDFYFDNAPSGIGDYYKMHPDPTGDTEEILTTPSPLSGSGQAVFEWISDEVVNFETIEAGVIDVHIHAKRATGNKSIELYAEIYEYTSTPAELLIATTEVSAPLTDDETGYDFHFGLPTDYDIASTSRLLVKILANLGTGSPTTISLYVEGTHDSHLSVRVPTHTLENLYVRRDILGANTILYSVAADTPLALAIAASRIVGRKSSGDIAALTGAEVATLIGSSTFILHSLADAANDFLVASGNDTFAKQTATQVLATLSGQAGAAFDWNGQELTGIDRQNYNETNLLENGDFEVGDPPSDWTLYGASATVSRSSTQAKVGTYSALLTRVGADCYIYQNNTSYADYASKKVTLGCWVYATVASRARLQIDDNVSTATSSSYHTGVAGWEWLTVTHTVDASPTRLYAKCEIKVGNTTAYFDGAILVEGDSCPAFSDKPINTYDAITLRQTLDADGNKITNLLAPVAQLDGANKKYVDDTICEGAHFNGTSTSRINCGALYSNIPKLWVSFWFKLEKDFSSADSVNQMLWTKFKNSNDQIYVYLRQSTGKLEFFQEVGNGPKFLLTSTTTSWSAGVWYHVILSMSDTDSGIQRLLINNSLEDSSTQANFNTPDSGNFEIGYWANGPTVGFVGTMRDYVVGTDDLSEAEETALYNGVLPGDEVNEWRLKEGEGATATDTAGSDDGTLSADTGWSLGFPTISVASGGGLRFDSAKIIQFYRELGVKIRLYDTSYTIGIDSDTLYLKTGRDIEFREGGDIRLEWEGNNSRWNFQGLPIYNPGDVDGVDVSALDTAVVKKALYDANSILAAVNDNDPAVLAVAASRILGRKASGNIAAMTVAELLTLIGVEAGATADQTGAEMVTALEALSPGSQLSHTELDDVGASDHHAKAVDNELYGKLKVGVASSRPAAGNAETWYYSTDTKVLECDTGAAWVEVARGETVTRLASLSEKDHASLGSVTSDQHHAQSHSLASHSTKAHSELSDAPEGAHHTKFTTAEHTTIGNGAPHHTKYTDASARSAAVSNTAYAASWNGVTTIAPSKNVVYDKIETLSAGDAGEGHIFLLPLAYDSIIQGAWAFSPQLAELGGYFRVPNVSNADGDGIIWKVYLAAGTYTLIFIGKDGAGGAIVDFYIDAAEVASFDTYNGVSSDVDVIWKETGIVVATSGIKEIKGIVDGRHASATQWQFNLQAIILWRTA